jgi:hypothetical protein
MVSLALCLLLHGSAPAMPPNSPALADGTLLFLENCNSVVEYSTKGKIGHVGLVFRDAGETYIYEATPGKVRRVTADEYMVELARLNKRRDADDQIRVWMLRPKREYTAKEAADMRAFLDAQIGRRYSLRNYVMKQKSDGKHDAEIGPLKIEIAVGGRQPTEGIHCAELASTTLVQSGRYGFTNCHKINPHALYTAVLPTHHAPQEIAVLPLAAKESWCTRAQRRWGEAWTWCGWSCGEAWAFCW